MSPAETSHVGKAELNTGHGSGPEGKMGRDGGPNGKTARRATPEGKAEPRRPANKTLPPCRVCDGPGAGLHYGVNTCDPCKAFFRRTLTGTKALKCHVREGDVGRCVITKATKNPCSHCRLKKCQAVGMSKSAIRLGRYTIAKKTRDTIELKTGQGVADSGDYGRLEDFAKTVMSAHKSTLEYMYHQPGYENIEELKRQVTEQLVHEPEHEPLDSETFLKLYRQGIEPDCRMRNLKVWMEYLSVSCTQFVMFLQKIPGFKDLPHEDKITLAKSVFVEMDIMSHASLHCDHVNVLFIPHDGTYVPVFLDNIFGKELTRYPMRLVSKLREMDLTPEELCLVKVLCIFATERSSFKDTKGIDAIRQTCLDALYQVMGGYSDKVRNLRFSKIVDILQFAVGVAHLFENFLRKTLIHFTSVEPLASAPAIAKEMIFSS